MRTEAQKKKHAEDSRQWRKEHKEYHGEYIKKHREKRRIIDYRGVNKLRFGGLRDEVLKRDNWTCQKCGMTNEEHYHRWGRKITVHHKDGKGRYSKEKNHTMDNMITECLSCHNKSDTERRKNQ